MPGQSNNDEILHQQKAQEAQQKAIQHYRAGNFKDALIEARIAADIVKSNVQLQNLVGAIAIETDDPAAAVQYLQHSLSLDTNQPETHYLLGNAFIKLGLDEQAVASFEHALALNPMHANAALNLGQCLNHLKDFNKAERAYRRAIEIDANHPEANHALAELYIRKTQYDKAEKHAAISIDADPDRVELVLTLAKALRLQNRFSEAEAIYRAAQEKHPHNALLLIEIGSVLRDQNKFDEAEKEYEKALELAPKNFDVLRSVASYYQSLRKSKRAAEVYERCLEIRPDDAAMLNNMAIMLRDLDDFVGAEKSYLKAVDLVDDPSFLYNNLAILAMEMSRPYDSIDYYRKALEIEPTYANARSNMLFYMNYLEDITQEELFKEHLEWERWHTEPIPRHSLVHANDPDPDRRLKIGYVSADFYGHAVSYFIEAALKNHNKDVVDVYCYANVSTPDAITKRLKSYVDNWFYITKKSPDEVVELIREHEIDILIDLGGHTAGHCLDIFALKPAPIQVTWIGYPNTTGLSTVDYRFVDDITDPVGDADKTHSETLWRLPESFTCYTPQGELPVEEFLAAMKTGQVTFGSFNNATKITKKSIRVWAEILKKVKNSRLILKSASLSDADTQKRIWSLFKEFGVPAKRVEMLGKLPSDEHLRMYDQIDIALDPFPYNGTTTSCEALMMGSPIIALLGDRHASRVTASLLHQVGLGDLAAATEDEYVEKAAALAGDLDRLQDIRKNLRTNMLASPLCDGARHTKFVEDAYREMWQIWCKEEPVRRTERLSKGLPETSPYKPPLPIIYALGNMSVTQFFQCLGSMNENYMLTDMHPLGMKVISPLQNLMQFYSLFTEEEWEVLPKKEKISLSQILFRTLDKLEDRGGTLITSVWSHLDFIAQPFLAAPTYEMYTRDELSPDFELLELFVVCHPISQWQAYCDLTNVAGEITVEEFLRGYRHFAEFAAQGLMIKCEDFAKNPSHVLKGVCDFFRIDFDPAFEDNWPFYLSVTGDPFPKTLEARALQQFSKPNVRETDPETVARMEDNKDYETILELLGYEK